MKKLAGLTIIVAMLMLFVPGALSADNGEEILTLDDIVSLAEKNSRQAVLDDYSIKEKESYLKDVEESAKQGGYAASDWGFYNNKIKVEVKPMEARNSLEIARRTKEENLKRLRMDVRKAALEIYYINEELAKENKLLSITEEKFDLLKAKYSTGTVSESQLADAEYSLESKRDAIKGLEARLKAAEMNLNRLLGLPLNSPAAKVQCSIEYKAPDGYDVEEMVEKAIARSLDIYISELNLAVKTRTMEIADEYFDPGENAYDSAALGLESARKSLEDKRLSLEVDIRNRYNELLNRSDDVELARMYESIARKKFNLAENQYNEGKMSRESFLDAMTSYINAQFQKFSTEYGYELYRMDLDAMID